MLLQVCDKCGKPLSEGSIARGEAVLRDGESVCAQCLAKEQISRPKAKTGLARYEEAVWNCQGCGIPLGALDLIEDRASRVNGTLVCARCQAVPRPQPEAQPPAPPAPSVRRPLPSARRPLAVTPAAEAYVRESRKEQRLPILPLVLFAIVLPMFAVSVYFAITSQQRLNEAMTGNGNTPAEDRRQQRPVDLLTPQPPEPVASPPSELPAEPAPKTPEPAAMLTPEVAADLAAIEQQLAAPVILQLQSKHLPDVWEGLIAAGSRRYVAAKPWVRALLAEPDDNTRALACRVCALLSDHEALPQLDRMAETDPSEPVKIEARKAKGRLSGSATRQLQDMSTEELEKYLRELQQELQRRKATHD